MRVIVQSKRGVTAKKLVLKRMIEDRLGVMVDESSPYIKFDEQRDQVALLNFDGSIREVIAVEEDE
jgi:hypothetical protein